MWEEKKTVEKKREKIKEQADEETKTENEKVEKN